MANKYLISEDYLRRSNKSFKQTQKSAASLTSKRENGTQFKSRYLVKITGRYKGSNYTVDNNIALTGTQVYLDSGGDDIVNVTNGYTWGDDADSNSLPPIVDLTIMNYDYTQSRLAEEVHIDIGTVVEVFSKVTQNGDTLWFTYGAKDNEYVNDSAYPVDSVMCFDSEGQEAAFTTDSGVYNAQINSGFKITVQTRMFFGHDSNNDKVTYAYFRDFEYNAMGVLVSISSERRQEIDDRAYELFAVNVTQTSGSAGNATTKCSFTYTVTDIHGDQLLTGASPTWARPALGKLVAATKGTAYFNPAGTAVLYQIDEVPDVAVCP